MAVSIRLSRGGAKKRPYYRVVVADSRQARDGRYLEQIGTYNPLLAKDDEKRVQLNEDRARYWLGVGAQPSDRVARFLDAAGIRERAARSNPNKGEPGEKAKERAEERASKQAEAQEAAKTAETTAAETTAAETTAVEEEVTTDADGAEAATEEAVADVADAADASDKDANVATPKGEAGDQEPIPGASSQEPAEGGEEVAAEAEEATDKAEEKSEG